MKRNIIITKAATPLIEDQPVEIVERKGIGHPDTLCDGIAERIAVDYSLWCREHGSPILHHNFDKVQLVAGDVDIRFGGGELLKPIRIQIAGRGTPQTPNGLSIPIDFIAINAAKAHIRDSMRYLDPDQHCVIDCYAGRGAGELARTVTHITANDTSVGVAHWPQSLLEKVVYQTCQYINENLIVHFPIGEDIKVMGVRINEDISLTCAVPFLAQKVANIDQYRSIKRELQEAITAFTGRLVSRFVQVRLNTADNNDAQGVYLTLTGTSGEQGDDGAVGRGNRITGLITPFRASSLEATAGKNAISHVGKLYNVLALYAARTLVEQIPEVHHVQVVILSQIGQKLDQPLVATAAVHSREADFHPEFMAEVKEVLDNCFTQVNLLREDIIQGKIPLF